MCCLQYEKDKITEKIRRELKRVIADPAFTPDQVCRSICHVFCVGWQARLSAGWDTHSTTVPFADLPPAPLSVVRLQVGQQSKAAMSMCLWVRAMDTYATVYRIVEPKRKILAEAQAALDASNAALAQKAAQLQAIKDKVAALQQQLTDTQKQLAALQFQVRGRCFAGVLALKHQSVFVS